MVSVPRDTGFVPLPDRSIYADGVYPSKINQLSTDANKDPARWCPDLPVTTGDCGVRTLERAIGLYRADPAEFTRQWQALKPGLRMEVAWYGDPQALSFPDLTALRRAVATLAGTDEGWTQWVDQLRRVFATADDACQQLSLVLAERDESEPTPRWYSRVTR